MRNNRSIFPVCSFLPGNSNTSGPIYYFAFGLCSTWLFPGWILSTVNLENLRLYLEPQILTTWCLWVGFLACNHPQWEQIKLVDFCLCNVLQISSAETFPHWQWRSLTVWILIMNPSYLTTSPVDQLLSTKVAQQDTSTKGKTSLAQWFCITQTTSASTGADGLFAFLELAFT